MANPGEEVSLSSVKGRGTDRQRLTDLGLSEGMKLKVLQCSNTGPSIILVGNSRLILDRKMTKKILVTKV
jgi:Fe2+ transport system protein FeoA